MRDSGEGKDLADFRKWNQNKLVKGYLRYKTIFCYKVAFDVYIVCTPPPFLQWVGGGGLNFLPNFRKGGA